MINKVVLVGRLTKDVEVRKTTTGISTANFTLACNRRGRSENGPTADFINCVVWRQGADFLGTYAHKGDVVAVDGRITTRNYEGQNGRVYVTEVTAENVQLISSRRSNYESESVERTVSYDDRPVTYDDRPVTYDDRPVAYDVRDNIEEDLSSTPSLEISSDDLPFY